MGAQASKRQREHQHTRWTRPIIEGRSGTMLDDQVWLYRKVDDSSTAELAHAAQQLETTTIQPKTGNYTLSLLHPADVNMSIKRSSLRGYVSAATIYELISFDPLTMHDQAIEVGVKGLQAYGSRRPKIGIAIDSPELEQEHETLTSEIYRYLGITSLRQTNLHISLAYGKLRDLPNREQIEESLPDSLVVSPLLKTKKRYDI